LIKHKKANLLLIFDHQLAYRSYKETNIFDSLDDYFTTKICIIGSNPKNITSILDSKNTQIQLKSIESFFLALYANAYWQKIVRSSLSIQNRIWYGTNTKPKIFSANTIGNWYYKKYQHTPIFLTQVFLYRVLRIIWLIVKDKPKTKILYVTTGGTNSLSDILVKFFSRKKIEVFTIVENWDNMSSKAVFDYPPLRVGVWGEQSIKFGSIIHQIDSQRMISLGNPRVEWLTKNIKPNQFGRNIFFGGGSVDLDTEILFLGVALKIAKSLNTKLYYLPHPKFYNIINYKLSGIISNNLVIAGKIGGNLNEYKSLPKLVDYVPLFQEAKVFISPLSTLNLEASLLGIPSIAIDLNADIDVHKNLISDRHDHIRDIRNDDLFYFVKDLKTFEILLTNLMEESETLPITETQLKTLNYLVNNKGNYLEKLLIFLQ
jgi:hypothetical protein